MPARKTKSGAAIAVGVLVIVAVFVGLRVRSISASEPAAPGKAGVATASAAAPASAGALSAGADPAPPPTGEELAMFAYLKANFGPKIANRNIQVHLLEKLIGYYRQKDPARWRDAVLRALLAMFPDRYTELSANLQHWLDYEQWMKGNQGYLQSLSEKDRRAAMQELRERMFGKEAAAEIWASDLKNQAFTDALKAIDATPNATLPDKLAMYKETIEDIYQEKADSYLQQHAQEAMNHFFDLDSVQKQLSGMTPEERAKSLREIRKGMGLDEEALKRWDALDQARDARWDTGAKYMKDRAALAQQVSGAELEDKLRDLRVRYFGAEADTIAQEEQSGFFRFARPRKWGRN